MKKTIALFIVVFSGYSFLWSQNIRAISEEKLYDQIGSACGFGIRSPISSFNCDDLKICNDSTMEMSVTNCSPESSDADKQITIDAIHKDIDQLINLANCISFKYFLIYLGEGIYITEKDKLPYGSKKFNKKASKLNTDRFIKLYEQKLTTAFPNKKFYIINWGW